MEAVLHGLGVVDDSLDLDVGLRQFGAQQALDRGGHLIGDPNRVGPLSLEDVDGHGPLAIEDGKTCSFTRPIFDRGNVAQIDRLAGLAAHDNVVKILLIHQSAQNLDRLNDGILGDRAGGQILVGGLQRRDDGIGADIESGEQVWIDLDVELTRNAADHGGAADARDIGNALDDHVFGNRGQVTIRQSIRADRQRNNGQSVGVKSQHAWLASGGWQAGPDRVKLVADVLGFLLRIDIQVKDHQHHGLTGLGGGLDRVEPSDGVHRFFDRLDNVGFDSFGRSARVAYHHGHDREVDVRHLLDGQALI